MQNAWNGVEESWEEYAIALKSIEQAQENLRIYKNCYDAGTSTMTDLLQAQLLYQQAMDKKTEAYSAYMMKVLEYNQAIGK
jgi:outer membrane protein TolC